MNKENCALKLVVEIILHLACCFETSFQKRSFWLVFSFLFLKFTFADRNVCTQSHRKICRLKDSTGGYTCTSCIYSLRPGFHSEPVRVGFVVDKVVVVQVFPGVPPFSPVSNIPQILIQSTGVI